MKHNEKPIFPTEIEFDLELNKDVIDVLLQKYKKAYVMNKLYKSPEYTTIYDNTLSNINNEFTQLRSIQNELLQRITAQNKYIHSFDNTMKTLKEESSELDKKNKKVTHTGLASGPRYSDTKTEYRFTIAFFICQIIGIAVLLYTWNHYSTRVNGSSLIEMPFNKKQDVKRNMPVGL